MSDAQTAASRATETATAPDRAAVRLDGPHGQSIERRESRKSRTQAIDVPARIAERLAASVEQIVVGIDDNRLALARGVLEGGDLAGAGIRGVNQDARGLKVILHELGIGADRERGRRGRALDRFSLCRRVAPRRRSPCKCRFPHRRRIPFTHLPNLPRSNRLREAFPKLTIVVRLAHAVPA
jgi:hypothetical protein